MARIPARSCGRRRPRRHIVGSERLCTRPKSIDRLTRARRPDGPARTHVGLPPDRGGSPSSIPAAGRQDALAAAVAAKMPNTFDFILRDSNGKEIDRDTITLGGTLDLQLVPAKQNSREE